MAAQANTGIFKLTMRDVIQVRAVGEALSAVAPPRIGLGQAVFLPAEWRSLAARLGFTPRECGIVRAVFDGDSEKRIAQRIGLSPHTVHTYLWRIYRKLQIQSREALLVRVFAEFRSLPKRRSNGQ